MELQRWVTGFLIACIAALTTCVSALRADDWPMLGRDVSRNAVSFEKDSPLSWQVKGGLRVRAGEQVGKEFSEERGIRWSAALGSQVIAPPIVSENLVWIGTNNYDFNSDKREDASVLMCFDARDGQELYRYASPRRPEGRDFDWPMSPIGCSPLIQRDRMWFTTNRCETICFDIGPLRRGETEPRLIWKVKMHEELGVFPHGSVMFLTRSCSPASYKDWLYVVTNNGVDASHVEVPAPDAPSLVCFDRNTGKVVWTDNSPGKNILHGQWTSPLVIEVDGDAQVIVPQGDGWMRSFGPAGDGKGGSKVLWGFDINPKESRWGMGGSGQRNHILAAPVYYKGRVYIASGQEPEHGAGPGRLCCIDPTRRGDISSELAVDAQGKLLPRRRVQAVDPKKGETAIPNPNSGVVWEFVEGKAKSFEVSMHRTVSSVAIADDLLIACDASGAVHCLDAMTGERHWSYDMLAEICASPLIVGDKVYLADIDGDVSIFRLSRDPDVAMAKHNDQYIPIAEINMGGAVYASPIFANGALYIATNRRLFAIQQSGDSKTEPAKTVGHWPQWRGPNRDNVSTETGLLKGWPKDGPPQAWRVQGIGGGIASVAVAGRRVYTLGYIGDSEYVTALDEQSGQRVWAARIGPAVEEHPCMRWLSQRTPTIDRDQLYAFTSRGQLICLATADGRELWRKDYVKDFGGGTHSWGLCDYPLVDGDRVICMPGGAKATLAALDRITGKVQWMSQAGGRADWGAMVVIEIGGIRQFVRTQQRSIISFAADDGRRLWVYDNKEFGDSFNAATPIVRDNLVFAASGRRGRMVLLKLTALDGRIEWEEQFVSAVRVNTYQDGTALIDDYVYVLHQWGASCVELATGEIAWRARITAGSGRGSWVYADGHFYLLSYKGALVLIAATPKEYSERATFQIPKYRPGTGATQPVIAGGRLYVRNDDVLLCYDVCGGSPRVSVGGRKTIILGSPARGHTETSRSTPKSVFVPTPQDVVERMLELANVQKKDLIYDLGSGDGRIVIAAAKKYGCRAVGYEIDRDLVESSRENVGKAGVERLVTIEQKDVFTADLSKADVIAVYLLPKQLEKLVPRLQELKPGSRIVSHQFEIPGIKPDKTIEVKSAEDGDGHTIHFWTVPLVISK